MTTDTVAKQAALHRRLRLEHRRHRQGRRHDRAVDGHDAHRAHHRRRGGRAASLDEALRAAVRVDVRPARRRRLHVHQRHRAAARLGCLAAWPPTRPSSPPRSRPSAATSPSRCRPTPRASPSGSRSRVRAPPPRTTRWRSRRSVARDSLVKTAIFGVGPQLGAHRDGRGRARRRSRRPGPARHHHQRRHAVPGGVAAGDRTAADLSGTRGRRRDRAAGSATARPTSSPPTCRTPTSRRTVPTPPDGTLDIAARIAPRRREGGRARRGAAVAAAFPRPDRRRQVRRQRDDRRRSSRPAFAQDMVFLRLAGHPPGGRARRRPADHRDAGPAGAARRSSAAACA